MGAVNALLIWTGYWLLAYGVATVRSCNVKLLDIALPGHYKGCNPDPSSTGGQTAAQGSAAVVQNAGAGKIPITQAEIDQEYLAKHPGIKLQG